MSMPHLCLYQRAGIKGTKQCASHQ